MGLTAILLGLSIPVIVAMSGVAFSSMYQRRKQAINTLPVSKNKFETELKTEFQQLQSSPYPQLVAVAESFTQLWSVVEKDERKRQEIAVEYADTFNKLNRIFGQEYLGSITENPEHWDNATQRKEEVLKSAALVKEQILRNLRQENTERGLSFNTDLKLLNKNFDQLQTITGTKE